VQRLQKEVWEVAKQQLIEKREELERQAAESTPAAVPAQAISIQRRSLDPFEASDLTLLASRSSIGVRAQGQEGTFESAMARLGQETKFQCRSFLLSTYIMISSFIPLSSSPSLGLSALIFR
jgi:hypothetical protein